MKLSKSLLSAIMIGVAVQTSGSCTKDIKTTDTKVKKETKVNTTQQQTPPVVDPCCACGMG